MTSNAGLEAIRVEFARSRFLAMPIAGTIGWTIAGILGTVLPTGAARSVFATPFALTLKSVSNFACTSFPRAITSNSCGSRVGTISGFPAIDAECRSRSDPRRAGIL